MLDSFINYVAFFKSVCLSCLNVLGVGFFWGGYFLHFFTSFTLVTLMLLNYENEYVALKIKLVAVHWLID